MKKYYILILIAGFLSLPAQAKEVYVEGYYKSDGTYVNPEYRMVSEVISPEIKNNSIEKIPEEKPLYRNPSYDYPSINDRGQ